MFCAFRLLTADRRAHDEPRSQGAVPLLLALGLSLSGALGACSAEDVGGKGDSESPSTGDDAGSDDDSSGDDDDDDDRSDERNTDDDSSSGGDDDGKKNEDDDDKQDVEECAAIRQDAPPGKGAVDVVFLVDTSGSMLHAITQVAQNLSSFVQSFDDTNADTRVVMITGNDPAAGGAGDNYRFIKSEVDSQVLFETALARFPEYQDFLRSDAATQFVMVTDDEDKLAPEEFKQQMEALLGRSFTQHAIASEDVNGFPCISEALASICPAPIPAVCGAMNIGKAYYSLADQTQGEKMSICKADWSDVFAKLQTAVIEAVPLPCSYALADTESEEFDPAQVSIVYELSDEEQSFPKALTPDRCGDELGWHYDDNENPTTIKLCPAACDLVQSGGSIDIAFGCEPPFFL